MDRQIVLIAHNLRSAHNVGSLLRTAEGLGISKVYLTGYSPYPKKTKDPRLPHIANKVHARITKTSLGAENFIKTQHQEDIFKLLKELKGEGFSICALEQHENSKSLATFKSTDKIVLVLGREVEGLEPEVIDQMDTIVEIPMLGKKESFNVANAAAIALYHLRFS